ncbi:MAG: DUF4810 domain-containing protein [Phycisphaerales bacterium]|nr:DUF4810 domain-containing protein [Phycisphaerales bacterium]
MYGHARRVLLFIAPMGLLGCGPGTIYDWGSYEGSVLRMYTSENFSVETEIRTLSGEVEEAAREEKLVPPGKYAHLGYLYYLTGDHDAARRSFEAEKAAFPESAAFMDRMLEQL